MKLAIIVGHTKAAPGATSYWGESEYPWNTKNAALIVESAKRYGGQIEAKAFFRDDGGVAGAAERAKAWGATHSLELHFNAASNTALGCECLIIKGDVESAKYADVLTDMISDKFGIKERRLTQILPDAYQGDGVFETVKGQNGYANLLTVSGKGIKVRCLIEPAFMDKKTAESEKLRNDTKGYADVIVDAFAKVAGLKLDGTSPVTPTPEVPAGELGTLPELVSALKAYPFKTKLGLVRPWLLAQFLLESGRGSSDLFKKYRNAGGMKWRDELKVVPGASAVSYEAHDGRTDYAKFESFTAFLAYYEAFILRSPYKGFEDAIGTGNGLAYITHIKKAGYAEAQDYVSLVSGLMAEAEKLYGETPADPKPEEESMADLIGDLVVIVGKIAAKIAS